ncbi:hypothetical protein [Actinoplanes sp. DH11]|uniref:hypothetical protein n=1 Tax=Actinoplanes sp. DH11 TaxID=2857011 RepID=UPI001E28AC12|nr:hypothetical protein [Actinoplanes sp. DH11]
MGRVIYSVASSVDGYHTDAQGDFSWAVPDEEVIAALNADAAGVSTYLYGRKMSLRLGVVDVVELLLCPVVVGGGTRVLPGGWRTSLSLRRERRFGNGMVQLTYDVA